MKPTTVSFKSKRVTVYGGQLAVLILVEMVEHSVMVACEPLPNDVYAISVKLDAGDWLQRTCDTLALPSPEECAGKLVVVLTSCGDPDFRQYAPFSTPENRVVASLDEARQVCLNYITEHELGGGNWSGGDVLRDGELIARIGYNGTVFYSHEVSKA